MDEDFWRDVTKSVVSALIVAAVLFALAVFGGYVARPDTRFLTIGLLILVVVAVPPYIGWIRKAIEPGRSHLNRAGILFAGFGFAITPPLVLFLLIFCPDRL